MGCSTLIQTPELEEFYDEELGLSFQYPAAWGEVTLERPTYFKINISFSNQPEIYLTAGTLSDYEGDFGGWCEGNITRGGHYDQKSENGEDVYVYSGSYTYGNCEEDFPYLNSVITARSGHDWVPFDEEIDGSSEILLDKSYYANLENSCYPHLTISIDLPSIISEEVCLMRVSWGCDEEDEEDVNEEEEEVVVTYEEVSDNCPLFQSLSCLNYEERELTRGAFEDLENSELGDDIEKLLASITIEPAENAEELSQEYYTDYYTNYYAEISSDLSEYSNESLGISFSYPTSFGEVEFNEETSRLSFSDKGFMYIRISTLEDAIASDTEREAAEPAPYCNPITAANWEEEYEVFSNYNVDNGVSDGHEIFEINGNNMLVGRYGGCGERIYYKEYISFAGDKRFEIFSGILDDSIESYKAHYPTECSLFAFELQGTSKASVIESILESMAFFP